MAKPLLRKKAVSLPTVHSRKLCTFLGDVPPLKNKSYKTQQKMQSVCHRENMTSVEPSYIFGSEPSLQQLSHLSNSVKPSTNQEKVLGKHKQRRGHSPITFAPLLKTVHDLGVFSTPFSWSSVMLVESRSGDTSEEFAHVPATESWWTSQGLVHPPRDKD